MIKKQSSKKLRVNKIWLTVIALFVIQVITISYIIKLHSAYETDSSSTLPRLINESESKRYRTPIISIDQNRVYIPESRIFMPLTDTSRDLQYSRFSIANSLDVYLSITGAIGRQNSNDDPSCDKIIRISTSSDESRGEKFIGEIKPTKDGLRYIFQNNHTCSIYSKTVSNELAEIARLIQSY